MGQKHLTKTHREIIERWFGIPSIREIARLIGYSPAAVFMESRRNANKNGTCDAESAQIRADWRASKDKNAGKRTPFLTAYVQEKLAAYWSPEQIAGRLRREFPAEPDKHIAFKTIYCRLVKDAKQYDMGRPLRGHLRYLRQKGPGKRLVHDKKRIALPLPCITISDVNLQRPHRIPDRAGVVRFSGAWRPAQR